MITIFKPAEVTVTVIDGDPPTDQSATIAALEAERDAALAQVAAMQAKIDAALAALS